MVKIDCEVLREKLWEDGVLIDRKTIYGMCAAINTNKNMMFAGMPGTAKTMTAKALSKVVFGSDDKFHRITAYPGITRQDFFGDWNYQKQFLEIQASCSSQTCNPDSIKHIYRHDNFVEGPAIKAIQDEGILFVDEGNRGGEDFQNMLLEVSEEKQVTIPMLGTVKSNSELPITIVTYNEQDVGTEPFSDAFKRRFMRIKFHNLAVADGEKVWEKKLGKGTLNDITSTVKRVIG